MNARYITTFRLGLRVSVLVSLVVVWHIAIVYGEVGEGFIPTPLDVVQALVEWIRGGAKNGHTSTWFEAAIASSTRVAAGFAIAVAVGIPVGILIGRYKLAADLLDPLVQILRPIPVSAWVPFAIVLFGIKPAAAICLVAIGAFFPMVLNSAAGARHVSELHLRSAVMLGTPPLRTLYAVILPASLPSIVTGLRLAMGLAWVLVIVAEMVSVHSGFGYELWNAYYYARLDIIVACMISIGLFGYCADQIILLLSARFVAWHRDTQR